VSIGMTVHVVGVPGEPPTPGMQQGATPTTVVPDTTSTTIPATTTTTTPVAGLLGGLLKTP
jgi:hypothetical protein